MKITNFAIRIAKKEGGKVQANIAQISEILKIINILTKGVLYKIIELL